MVILWHHGENDRMSAKLKKTECTIENVPPRYSIGNVEYLEVNLRILEFNKNYSVWCIDSYLGYKLLFDKSSLNEVLI